VLCLCVPPCSGTCCCALTFFFAHFFCAHRSSAAAARRGSEQGKLVGRTQEWNISRKELVALVELGVLTQEEMDRTIVTDYSPQRVGFSPDGVAYELATINGVLNLGVDPLTLIELVKESFLRNGGILLEQHAFQQAQVYDDGVVVTSQRRTGGAAAARGAGGAAAFDQDESDAGVVNVRGKLMLDAMGNFSPVMRQARGYAKPQVNVVAPPPSSRLPASPKSSTPIS
jgi:lycopene cyclase CruP